MAKRREIRNSTAEFLIFQIEGKEQGVEVYYKDKTVWCTQKAMGMLFDCNEITGTVLWSVFERAIEQGTRRCRNMTKIKARESQNVEYKSSWHDKYLERICFS